MASRQTERANQLVKKLQAAVKKAGGKVTLNSLRGAIRESCGSCWNVGCKDGCSAGCLSACKTGNR